MPRYRAGVIAGVKAGILSTGIIFGVLGTPWTAPNAAPWSALTFGTIFGLVVSAPIWIAIGAPLGLLAWRAAEGLKCVGLRSAIVLGGALVALAWTLVWLGLDDPLNTGILPFALGGALSGGLMGFVTWRAGYTSQDEAGS